jgi:hypothetical protein
VPVSVKGAPTVGIDLIFFFGYDDLMPLFLLALCSSSSALLPASGRYVLCAALLPSALRGGWGRGDDSDRAGLKEYWLQDTVKFSGRYPWSEHLLQRSAARCG